ncbi:MAG TPA: ATP-grasp domain-containing protein [Gemmataceae bacterium]
MGPHLILIGASGRAAAFSAVRAGLRPWAIDLFADRDLAAVCPARAVPPGQYPAGLALMACEAPPGPWLYTGALENRPEIVERIARDRPLWGNAAAYLRRARDPFALAAALRAADAPCPDVRRLGNELPPGRWLLKPVASAGGIGIRLASARHSGRSRNPTRRLLLQRFVEGESRAGVFCADEGGCRLLGVTRQFVGECWLHAPPFRYAGSIGPLPLTPTEQAAWDRLGAAVTAFAGLRGLFGVDAVVRDGVPWPVEVNPRYTASVEVLEYATGLRALALHRRAFDPSAPIVQVGPRAGLVGKAVWYAPRPLTVPADGPWEAVLRQPPLDAPPAFADIPPAGQRVAAGRPVLTAFAAGDSAAECERRLRVIASELDAWLLK